MADEEEFPVDDNYGLIDQPEHADVVLEGVVTTGDEDGPIDETNPEPPTVEPITPVDSWAEVDPDYEELLDEDAEMEDVPDEDIPAGDPDTSGDDETPFEGVAWAFYEIEGRSFDRDGAWQQLAREEFTGSLDARIDGLPAGERWEFRVRLVDHDGIASAWSETTLDQLPVDETPPPAPTAPIVDENSGFITYGTDGTLTGPTPADMSHILAYVRQMHPAGQPDGDQGDPRLLGRFTGEGYQSTGSLVSEVPHEFWLVAVDTTGNGSQWSQIVTATPSEPVDGARIRQELEAINGPDGRLPALEQSLSDGFTARDQVISEIQQAAVDSAEAAQLEYDRLQGLAADAQAKADAVETDLGATAAEAQAARSEAQAAQAAADAAQTAAAAAQSAAGDAQSTADQAMSSANAKSRIYSSTQPPSGTAEDGDTWYRWSSEDPDRDLRGIWVMESGTWRSMGTLSRTLIPLLDIGAGTFGELSGDRLLADSVGAREVNTLDLATDTARMNQLWTGLAMIAEAQIDTLLGNTARFKEINAPLIQSHTDPDIGWKLRPDGTAMMREADVRGRFQAGTGSNLVEVDQGDVTYFSPIDNANRTLTGIPYLRFSTPDGAGGTTAPLIAAKPTGGLVIGSGRNSPEFGRSVIEIDGHVNALGADFTSHTNTTSVYASVGITGIGTNNQQLGGLVSSGVRTRLQGRTADSHNARDMYVRGVSSGFTLTGSDSIMRMNFTYGEPTPTGDRVPQVTSTCGLADNTSGRIAALTVGNISASGFQCAARPVGGGSPVSYNIVYDALWR